MVDNSEIMFYIEQRGLWWRWMTVLSTRKPS